MLDTEIIHNQMIKQVKLIDASFIWTEPHSKRLKLKLTIQKEVFSGVILQQVCVCVCVCVCKTFSLNLNPTP